MKRIKFFFLLFLCAMSLTLVSCSVELPAFARNNGCVNSPVMDTLFVTLPKEYEDQWVRVHIKSNDTDFVGREQLRDSRVWFDIRHLTTGPYTVWIEVLNLSFPQHIWHERSF